MGKGKDVSSLNELSHCNCSISSWVLQQHRPDIQRDKEHARFSANGGSILDHARHHRIQSFSACFTHPALVRNWPVLEMSVAVAGAQTKRNPSFVG